MDSAGVVWFLRDGHGSNRGLADGNGVVTAGYEYSGFGEALNFTAATARTVELFGGDGVYEAKTGWTYHLARWRSGFRFTSMDSYAGEAHDPLSLHKYLYANANPISNIDPDGRMTLSELGVSVGGMAITAGQYAAAWGVGAAVAGKALFVISMATYALASIGLAIDPNDTVSMYAKQAAEAGMIVGIGAMTLGVGLIWAGNMLQDVGRSLQALSRAQDLKDYNQTVGALRENLVARGVGGRVWNEKVTAPGLGSTDIDVLGPNGEYINAGGGAKFINMAKLGSKLQVQAAAAAAKGVRAMIYLAQGTPQKAIELAEKWLGKGNVFVF